MTTLFPQFQTAVEAAGLTACECSPYHWQIRGGEFLVNYYPATEHTAFGRRKRRRHWDLIHVANAVTADKGTIETAIKAARGEIKFPMRENRPQLNMEAARAAVAANKHDVVTPVAKVQQGDADAAREAASDLARKALATVRARVESRVTTSTATPVPRQRLLPERQQLKQACPSAWHPRSGHLAVVFEVIDEARNLLSDAAERGERLPLETLNDLFFKMGEAKAELYKVDDMLIQG